MCKDFQLKCIILVLNMKETKFITLLYYDENIFITIFI